MLVVRIAGWAFAVSVSSDSGPSKQIFEREKPRAASASANTARASACASQRSRPIPTFCELWPGKRKAIAPAGVTLTTSPPPRPK